MSLSSPSRLFNISSEGMITKISASRLSNYSSKLLCFSPVASITEEKWMSWWHFLWSIKYVRPWVHVFSNSTRISTSSTLFLSCGSTISMFYSYFLSRFLKSRKAFLILSASALTALDWCGLTLLKIPSAASRISLDRSSLPIPSGLATELILPRIYISFALLLLYSWLSFAIFPRRFSLFSIYESSFSVSIASVMKRLASASININSRT